VRSPSFPLKEETLKTCTKCGTPKPLDMFGKDKQKKDGLKSACKECYSAYDTQRYWSDPAFHRERRKKHYYAKPPEARSKFHKEQSLRLKYGLTPEQHAQMLEDQDYACAICKTPESEAGAKGLAVDHCHDSGRVRKLLCSCCNTALGLLKENPTTISNLLHYVQEHTEESQIGKVQG
jgi:hypothetical protein